MTMENDGEKVVQDLILGDHGKPVLFFKHMTHHLLPEVDTGWFTQVAHAFLIRDPREVLLSYVKSRPAVTAEDIGVPAQLQIHDKVRALTGEDFRRILTEPKACLIKQYVALMQTEGVSLEFTPDSIEAIADIAAEVNTNVENIGARRLMTVMERILDDISFDAADKRGEKIVIDAAYVREHIGDLAKNADLSKFIL